MKEKYLSILLCVLILGSIWQKTPMPAQAATVQKLQLSQVQSLAKANSSAYKKKKVKLELKQASLASAQKSIALKKRNLSTIRYSPLLKLKFPDKAKETEEVEFVFKPLQIQSEIASIAHEMTDVLLGVKEEVSNLYIDIYTLQESIRFNENRLRSKQDTLVRNEARLLIGEANQSDIDSIQKSISTLESKIATDERKLLSKKKKLGQKINLDISTGYELNNPYQEAELPRSQLSSFIEYTLNNDHTYYQAKAECKLALLLLDTNYNIIKGKYGGKLNAVAAYVNSAKQGNEVDSYALKQAYDQFLQMIDAPWNGKFRIIFIKLPREWLKGAIDGSRFLQDDPYALYTCILDYQDALKEEQNTKDDITAQVEEGYENLVTGRNAYLKLKQDSADLSKQVEAARYKNKIGKMTFEELSDLQQEYEDTQKDALDALSLYSQLLFSYDRLTCGAITKYMAGESLALNASSGGNSYLVSEEQEGISYYIKMMIEDYAYEFGIFVPEEFDVEITDYELWCGNYQIGGRTAKENAIKHLAYSIEDTGRTFVRLYNGDTLVDDCEFDPQEYAGPLTISKLEAAAQETKKSEGTYALADSDVGTSTIRLSPTDEEIAYYTVHNGVEHKLYSKEYIPIKEGFTYFTFALNDLEQLYLYCYDANKNQIKILTFDTEKKELLTLET